MIASTRPPGAACPDAVREPLRVLERAIPLQSGAGGAGELRAPAGHLRQPTACPAPWRSAVPVSMIPSTSIRFGVQPRQLGIQQIRCGARGAVVGAASGSRHHPRDGTAHHRPRRLGVGSAGRPAFGAPGTDPRRGGSERTIRSAGTVQQRHRVHPRSSTTCRIRRGVAGVAHRPSTPGSATPSGPAITSGAPGVALRDLHQFGPETWGRAAPGVDQDRHAEPASAKIGSHSPQAKDCACGCSLIPRAPAARSALRLGDRRLQRVEPAERDARLLLSRARTEHLVVGQAVGRIPLRVVQREHARALAPPRRSSISPACGI